MQIQHLALFILGFILQAFLLVRNTEYKRFLALLKFVTILTFFIFIWFAIKANYYTPQGFIIIFIFVFTILFLAVFIKDFLIQINELILLSFTLIFWYVFLLRFQFNPFLIICALPPTIGVIFVSFTKFQLKNYQKLMLYLWFLVIDVFLLTHYFIRGSFFSFSFTEKIGQVSLINSFFMGATFLYLACNVLCFFLFFTVIQGGKSFRLQPFKQTMQAIIKNTQPIIAKYSNEESKTLHSLMLIILQGSFLALNYLYKFIPDSLIISLFVTIIPQLLLIKSGSLKEPINSISPNRL
ncbi:MAG: hypothetical protein NTU58_00785 [Candidatus Nealsonbacteria bacterium]|nr:hypothetical protein [Candidatus Nealsonbacteria bacterium]